MTFKIKLPKFFKTLLNIQNNITYIRFSWSFFSHFMHKRFFSKKVQFYTIRLLVNLLSYCLDIQNIIINILHFQIFFLIYHLFIPICNLKNISIF